MAGKTYSFLDVVAALTGPGGVADLGAGAAVADEGITVSATGNINEMVTGADGAVIHSLYADRSGKVVVTLLKNSPMNAVLMALYNFQTASAGTHGQNTIVISHKVTGDTISCQQVAFAKAPDLSYGKSTTPVSWEFDVGIIDRALGGIV